MTTSSANETTPSEAGAVGAVIDLALQRAALRALEIVARRLRVSPAALRAPTRGPAPVARARQLAAYLCCTSAGLSLTAVGRALGRDRTTIAHACQVVEDLRDDPARPAFEATLRAMEAEFQEALGGAGGKDGAASRAARA